MSLTGHGFASSPNTTKVSEFCAGLGLVAGTIASNSNTPANELSSFARYISQKTAFDLSETKGRINELARNAGSLKVLTPAELAAHTYFWCVYDELDVEPGDTKLFDIERKAFKRYQTMFPR